MKATGLNPKAAGLKPEDIADMSVCKKFDESGFLDTVGYFRQRFGVFEFPSARSALRGNPPR